MCNSLLLSPSLTELSFFNHTLFCVAGLCPDWEDWNPKNAKKNAKEAMDNAEKWLDIPQVQFQLGVRGQQNTSPYHNSACIHLNEDAMGNK